MGEKGVEKAVLRGARGSLPTSSPDLAEFGGNTFCVTFEQPDVILCIDAGTGIVSLGAELMKKMKEGEESTESVSAPPTIHILFTHFHLDHIVGIPGFGPLYSERFRIHFHACPRRHFQWREALEGLFASPYWPVSLDYMRADISFHDFPIPPVGTTRGFFAAPQNAAAVKVATTERVASAGATRQGTAEMQTSDRDQEELPSVEIGGCRVSWCELMHPQGCSGFQVNTGEGRIVVATDCEHPSKGVDENLVALAQEADVLLYDAHFAPEEYETHRGWGHSTWQQGTQVANVAGVKRLVLVHHAPRRPDTGVKKLVAQAREVFPATWGGFEGMPL